jgi:hypothetical protein
LFPVRDHDLDEMLGLVEVIVGAAVMCEHRGVFISKITSMDHISQAVLKALIQRVMERVTTPAGSAGAAGSAGTCAAVATASAGDGSGAGTAGGEESEDYIRYHNLKRTME